MHRRARIEMEFVSRVDHRVLRWFGHVERMDEYHMVRRVLMAEVTGRRVWGMDDTGWLDGWCEGGLEKQRNGGGSCTSMRKRSVGWMDDVKVALRNRGMVVEAACQAQKIGKSGEPWYICNWRIFMQTFLLGPVFFRTTLPCSGGYHLERGGMPLHEKGATTVKRAQLLNTKVQMSSIWDKGCMLMTMRVLSDLIWLPLVGGGRKSRYIL